MNKHLEKRIRKNIILLPVWGVIASIFLFMPSPRGWGDFGRHFSRVYDKISYVLQPCVHFTLMAICACMISSWFPNHPPGKALLYSIGLTGLIAIVFEIAQSALPPTFSRQCDRADLLPSFVGACVGSSFWLISCYLKRK